MHHKSYIYTQTITQTVSTYCVQALQPRSGTYLFDPASILRDNTPLGILKSNVYFLSGNGHIELPQVKDFIDVSTEF